MRYDAAVLGAGLNSLVAAAYLARAGKKVLVAERAETVGGAAASEELAPGFTASVAFGSAELFHPEIARDLQLAGNGLELLSARGGTFVPVTDGESLHVADGSTEAAQRGIARHNPADAEAFTAFQAFVGRLAD